jgi:hypothetical protein
MKRAAGSASLAAAAAAAVAEAAHFSSWPSSASACTSPVALLTHFHVLPAVATMKAPSLSAWPRSSWLHSRGLLTWMWSSRPQHCSLQVRAADAEWVMCTASSRVAAIVNGRGVHELGMQQCGVGYWGTACGALDCSSVHCSCSAQ